MVKKLLFFSLLLPLFCAFQILQAQQEVIATTGGSAEASGTELEWTVGEIMVESYSSSENMLTQGIHQPFIIVESSIAVKELDFSLELFPVPASQFISVKTGNAEIQELHAIIIDLNGKKVLQHNFAEKGNQIDLRSLPASTYIVRFINKSGDFLKSFTIVKQ